MDSYVGPWLFFLYLWHFASDEIDCCREDHYVDEVVDTVGKKNCGATKHPHGYISSQLVMLLKEAILLSYHPIKTRKKKKIQDNVSALQGPRSYKSSQRPQQRTFLTKDEKGHPVSVHPCELVGILALAQF